MFGGKMLTGYHGAALDILESRLCDDIVKASITNEKKEVRKKYGDSEIREDFKTIEKDTQFDF